MDRSNRTSIINHDLSERQQSNAQLVAPVNRSDGAGPQFRFKMVEDKEQSRSPYFRMLTITRKRSFLDSRPEGSVIIRAAGANHLSDY